jgi:cytochrome c oxidase subunit III
MKTAIAVDASGLTRFPNLKHPLWWGVLGVVMIEATVVATLLSSYVYLWSNSPEWPPEGVDPPDLLWPSINVVLLGISAFTMWWAGQGINRGSRTILTLGTGASVALASLSLVLRSFQLGEFDVRWDDGAYGSIVWTITGFHYTHVASAIVGTAVVTLLSAIGYFTPERQLGVVVDTLYWYFVAGAFVPIYLMLYWAPRLA